jgi:hypothetical protein
MIYDRYEYILVVVDIYSRYADARPLTNRENKTIMENLKDIERLRKTDPGKKTDPLKKEKC